MTQRMEQYFVVVRRESSRVTEIEIFERVTVEVEESFKARYGKESRAFSIRLPPDGTATISEMPCEDRPYVAFPWYDEKYVCKDSLDLYERVSAITQSSEVRSWLGTKL